MRMTALSLMAGALAFTLAGGATAQPIEMDGRDAEWPAEALAVADGGAVYFRLSLHDVTSIQSAPWQISLLIDVDGDPESGDSSLPGADGMGVDLEFRMSPFDRDRIGYEAFQHPGAGARALLLPPGAHGFFWAPTHASDTFEFRMTGLPPHESVRARFVALDVDGDIAWETEPFGIVRGGTASAAPAMPALPKPEGALRVLSINVHWASPFLHPDAFERIFKAFDPDVLLVQEWDDQSRDSAAYTAEEIDEWLTAVDPNWESWNVVKGSERGVALISRYPLEKIDTDALRPKAEGNSLVREDRGIRAAVARVKAPGGDILAASVHLKCCGAYGGAEDAQRLAEARALNGLLKSAMQRQPVSMVVIGGDMNLVGDPTPLAALADGIDVDKSTLETADTVNLGTRRRLTWRGGDERFPPGRLDYVLYSGAGGSVQQAFVIDPSGLDDAMLTALGLEEGDLTISDHMPIVVDFASKVKDAGSR